MRVVTLNDIKENDIVEIGISYKGKKRTFSSEVLIVLDDALLIAPIMSDEKAVGFPDDLNTRCSIVIDGAPYVWDNPRIRLVKYEGKIFHMITLSGEGAYENRRKAFRQYLGIEIPIIWYKSDGEREMFNVLMRDLSETGAGFVTEKHLERNDKIRLRISDRGYLFNLDATIVRIQEEEGKMDIIYGCRFNEDVPKLSQYIMEIQRNKLKSSRTVQGKRAE